MLRKISRALIASALMTTILPTGAQALYRSDSQNTGIEQLDYIENQKRIANEQKLTPEQEELKRDTAEMRAKRKTPLDPNKPSPAVFEGDEIFYDMKSGDAYAKGNVRITQEEGRRFFSDEARGNLTTQDVFIEDAVNVLQLVPGKTRIRLTGFHTEYNYGTQTGKMFNGDGKVGTHYIKGKRFEFYPDRLLISEAVATKCGAKKPDYSWKAKNVEIFPEDIMILHDVSFYIKGVKVFSKKRLVVDISGGDDKMRLPRAGYEYEDGWWLSQEVTTPVAKNLDWVNYVKIMGHEKVKGYTELRWKNTKKKETLTAQLQYGFYEDSNSVWLRKEPSARFTYSNRIMKELPLSYNLSAEVGRWKQAFRRHERPTVRSTHRYYYAGLTHDTITFFRDFKLNLGVGYGVTKETYLDSTTKGFSWSALLTKPISPAVMLYTGYYYSAANTTNSVFTYDLDNYSKKLEYGFSVRISPRDRIAMGQYYDVSASRQRKIEYYWFHDFHCAQMIVRYQIDRDKRSEERNTFKFLFEFTPW